MRKLTYLFILLIFISTAFILPSNYVSAQTNRVIDEAGLLSTSEETTLESYCDDLYSEYSIDFIIMIKYNVGAFTDQEAVDIIDDYYLENYNGDDACITMVMINSLDSSDRIIQYICYNNAKNILTNSLGDSALDIAIDEFNYDGSSSYAVLFESLLEAYDEKISSNIVLLKLKPHLIIAGFALLISGVFIFGLIYNSSAKDTVNNKTYESNSKILGRYDRYVRSTVTKMHKPKSNGGSSGGRSRAGGSGGGRRF